MVHLHRRSPSWRLALILFGVLGTAATPSAFAQVPSGYSILGDSPTPPTGYVYTGDFLTCDQQGGFWSASALMPTTRDFCTGGVANSKIYVIGGTLHGNPPVMATNECFDPATATWTTVAAMTTARWGSAAAVVNNKIYVLGGSTTGGYVAGGLTASAKNEMFDPAAGTWTTKAALPTARTFLCAVSVGTVIYAIGGDSGSGAGLTTVEAYDTVANTWSTKAAIPSAVLGAGATGYGGKVYVAGGMAGGFFQNNLRVYDPVANTWTSKLSLSTARAYLSLHTIQGSLVAYGGLSYQIPGSATVYGTTEMYDVTGNTWTALPLGNPSFAHAGATIGNKLYGIGGDYQMTITTQVTVTSTNSNRIFQAAKLYYVHRKT